MCFSESIVIIHLNRTPKATLYTWSMEIEPTLPGAGIMARVFTRFMRKNARGQQQRFKRVMEEGGTEP